jgi:leucyl aminopeptidase
MKSYLSATAIALTLSLAPSLATAKTTFQFENANLPSGKHVTVLVDSDGVLTGMAAEIDSLSGGRLSEAIENADFKGKFGETRTFYGLRPYTSLTVVGMGDKILTAPKLHDLGGYIAKASDNDLSIEVVAESINTPTASVSANFAAGYAMGSYTFKKYKTNFEDKDRTVTFIAEDAAQSSSVYNNDLAHLVKGQSFARDMGTEPGKSMYPELFAQRVSDMFRGVPNVSVEVLDLRDLARNNMGALIGVGQGSVHDPRLIVVNYRGGASGAAPIALVGKGITFDTGGISIKPNSGQWLMKSDLSGAAAVAGTVYAAAKRGEKVNVVGVMSMAENMPSGKAIRPGDVLETMSGKTIEVMSTDAEGRLVLSDAVTYVQEKHDPSLLIDIATLTGSVGRALGTDYAGVITRDWALSEEMMVIGKSVGEPVWPLPLNKSHYKAIKSDIADIKSTAGSPGASIGGAVIGTFIDEDQPWVHLDIAGVDWLTSGTPTSPKGHSGWGVRFMDGVLRDKAAN